MIFRFSANGMNNYLTNYASINRIRPQNGSNFFYHHSIFCCFSSSYTSFNWVLIIMSSASKDGGFVIVVVVVVVHFWLFAPCLFFVTTCNFKMFPKNKRLFYLICPNNEVNAKWNYVFFAWLEKNTRKNYQGAHILFIMQLYTSRKRTGANMFFARPVQHTNCIHTGK